MTYLCVSIPIFGFFLRTYFSQKTINFSSLGWGCLTSAVLALDDAVAPVAVGLVVPLGQGDLLLAQVADDLGVEVVEADALALDVDLEHEAEDEAAGGHQLQPHQHTTVLVVARVRDES